MQTFKNILIKADHFDISIFKNPETGESHWKSFHTHKTEEPVYPHPLHMWT